VSPDPGPKADSVIERAALTVIVPKELHRRLKAYCAEHGTSMKEFVNHLIEDGLSQRKT
jgi:predicted HicB family RNase H-like nuclease